MSIDRMALAVFARRSAAFSLALLVFDVCLYALMIAGTILADAVWQQLLFSVGAGTMIALTAIVGHDAGHQSFSSSKRLNRICGTIAFLPALHPFSLWEHHHNRVHHRFTAQLGVDNAFPPMTVEDYRAASPWTRRKYRFIRSLWGQPFFYLVDVWLIDMFLPFTKPGTQLSRRDWFDLGLVYAYLAAFIALTTWATMQVHGTAWPTALASALVFSLILPFVIWNGFISFLSIVHHTAPNLRWHLPAGRPSTAEESLQGTVHMLFPEWVDIVMHRIMQHQAHHLNVGIPLQQLKGAQAELESSAPGVLTARWNLRYHLALTRQCQLYDHKAHRWCTFREVEEELPQLAQAA